MSYVVENFSGLTLFFPDTFKFQNPFDIQPQGTAGSGDVRRTSSSSSSPFTQPSPSNLLDDLSSIFGGTFSYLNIIIVKSVSHFSN